LFCVCLFTCAVYQINIAKINILLDFLICYITQAQILSFEIYQHAPDDSSWKKQAVLATFWSKKVKKIFIRFQLTSSVTFAYITANIMALISKHHYIDNCILCITVRNYNQTNWQLYLFLFTSFVINDWWSLQSLLLHSQDLYPLYVSTM
jgi:hypothetical protein